MSNWGWMVAGVVIFVGGMVVGFGSGFFLAAIASGISDRKKAESK